MNIRDMETKISGGVYNNAIPYSVKTREIYRTEEQRLTRQFRCDIAQTFGWVVDSKLETMIWLKAWDNGHAEGYSSVLYHYREFTDVAREALIEMGMPRGIVENG